MTLLLGLHLSAYAIVPSDCLPRDADSTCNTAIQSTSTVRGQDRILYDGPLAGVPAQGYAYWGYDFASDAQGRLTVGKIDMFVNRTPYPVTIRLTFNIPTDHPCQNNCRPGTVFYEGPSWTNFFPIANTSGDKLWVERIIQPWQAYGWVIGLWEATNPRLTVTVAKEVSTTLTKVGLPEQPDIAQEVPPADSTCECPSLNEWLPCSAGSHYTNGLDGPWYRSDGGNFYVRAGAYYSYCPSN